MSGSKRRVVVTQRLFDEATLRFLIDSGCEVEVVHIPDGGSDSNFSEDELASLLHGANGWIVGQAYVTRRLLTRLPELQVVGRRGVGYDRVDVDAIRDLGKILTIAAGGNDASVADHTIALILAVLRRLQETQAQMRNGDWTVLRSNDLYQKTVGLVGLGRIGKGVVKRLQGFDTKIIVAHPRPDREYGDRHGITFVDIETLLGTSDIVTLHAPLVEETRHLINADTMRLMKPTAILINVARGGLVDDRALLNALHEKRIAGAGLDVFEAEGDRGLLETAQALLSLPNVVGTPHAAASSEEGLIRTNMVSARTIVAVLTGEMPDRDCIVVDGCSH